MTTTSSLFHDCGDGKHPEAGKWRRGCRLKSFFACFAFTLFALLLLSNFFIDPSASTYWTWGMPAVVIEPNIVDCRTQTRVQTSRDCNSEPRTGKDLLPKGIAVTTSNLQLQPLGRFSVVQNVPKVSKILLAVAAGIKQKHYVNRIVQKFLVQNSTVIIFHYDGVVDKWHDLSWSADALHIVGMNQTKWWYAKRFLHPDIVAPYDYVFVWDEDLSVENFNVGRYLAIVKEEDLEISQPALDSSLSDVHHRITARIKKTRVHRRNIKPRGSGRLCFENSTDPPCTGWVEGMAPVFSRDAWRCVWNLIQNDLVHGWGMDFKLGYCVKGDRSRRVGVVDSEFIVHRGIPSLGGPAKDKKVHSPLQDKAQSIKASAGYGHDARSEVRRRSFAELDIFSRRWQKAAKEDDCWRDPYKHDGKTADSRSAAK